MESELNHWRSRSSGAGRGRGRRFSSEMQQEAVALVGRAVNAGWSMSAACEALGIPLVTLSRWREQHGAFAKVRVVDSLDAAVELHVGGARARVSIEQLAELIRRLS